MYVHRKSGYTIKEKESHIGIDIKEESMSAYHSTRKLLQEFIQKKYHVSDLAFSQLTENFIYELQAFCLGELGHQQSTFFRVAADLKTVCRLAYREGLADTLLFDNVHIERGNKKAPKALDQEEGVSKCTHPLFLCTKPRLSQARALLFPKVFVPLGIQKISLWQRYTFVLTYTRK